MKITQETWSKTPDDKAVIKYIITIAKGASVTLSSLGACIVSAIVPDKEGKSADVVLGYDDPLNYTGDGPCFGKCPGEVGKVVLNSLYTRNVN